MRENTGGKERKIGREREKEKYLETSEESTPNVKEDMEADECRKI